MRLQAADAADCGSVLLGQVALPGDHIFSCSTSPSSRACVGLEGASAWRAVSVGPARADRARHPLRGYLLEMSVEKPSLWGDDLARCGVGAGGPGTGPCVEGSPPGGRGAPPRDRARQSVGPAISGMNFRDDCEPLSHGNSAPCRLSPRCCVCVICPARVLTDNSVRVRKGSCGRRGHF